MKQIKYVGVAVLLAVLAIGSAFLDGYVVGHVSPTIKYHGTLVLNLVDGADESVALWKVEVGRRFSDPVILFCHGYDAGGMWVTHPQNGDPERPVRDVALELKADFPNRPIVLICCNPGHRTLGVPGVYHANDLVWMATDKSGNEFIKMFPDAVGNIFEFTDN